MSKLKSIVSLLSGYVRVHTNLTVYEQDRVVINSRNDNTDASHVKLISGGGSGHEPAHSGYVGDGMLTTSVCGELFASPSVLHILNATLMTGGVNTSILFIVKNYTGDRLNFGLAIELAKNQYNYKNIDLVVINDDISIDDNKVQPSVGRRGLAGTVFYHKIIGAMAAQKKSLSEICTYVNSILANNVICTVGFTFTTDMPDGIRNVEIGKGIHGEPGVELIDKLDDFEKIYQKLLDKFYKKIVKGSNVVLMVNNLGGTSQFLMNILLNEIFEKFSASYKIVKTYVGHFLTSLNSEGISVTLINLSDPKDLVDIMQYLEYPTSVPCNIFEVNVTPKKSENCIIKDGIKLVEPLLREHNFNSKFLHSRDVTCFKNIVVRCAHDLIANTDLLNEMDSEFGDGDTGSSLANFASQIELDIKRGTMKAFNNPKMIIMQLAEIARTFVGGTTGPIYSLFFQGVASEIVDGASVDYGIWTLGIKAGIDNIMKYGHAQKGDRTLLDPLIVCSDALQNFTAIQTLTKLCDDAVAETQYKLPKAGRATYAFSMDPKPRQPKFPDAGATAIGIMVKAIVDELGKH